MRRFLKGLVEATIIFGLAIVLIGSLISATVGYFLLCERFGVLWPSVVLVLLYLLSVFIAWAVNKHVKNESKSKGVTSPSSSGGGSVVKLNDLTVARAIQESNKRRSTGVPPDLHRGSKEQ